MNCLILLRPTGKPHLFRKSSLKMAVAALRSIAQPFPEWSGTRMVKGLQQIGTKYDGHFTPTWQKFL